MEPTMIELRHYHHGELPAGLRELLINVHADAYAAEMEDPFVQRFPWFVDHWSALDGFACVVGFDGEEPIGFAYGAPARTGREWWREHVVPAPERDSTFSFSELMVRPRWRKTGVAERLHSALMADRPEALAVLLVDPEHPKVQALYESWGYRKVGDRQPFPDSPRYAVMLRSLR
ncbi:GNAT family N-acetyltransferase [Streptomyces sp. CB01881]|uniref:GNAT family N-acetyltransferase n=1 Tax=Streptomyces sp. CB01881 TaxID=2078691 RepID=UPI000CDBE0B8|nr:GNAT family N-acetyltransferase [Streptomyces sp. CB01881]AUY52307.1 GNAT family N-acetyltransferase [Streptomyces sp. CB01881]TYC71729.1 GNAT family N-acetyltransferase [Streptomyces sp. CB01881]